MNGSAICYSKQTSIHGTGYSSVFHVETKNVKRCQIKKGKKREIE